MLPVLHTKLWDAQAMEDLAHASKYRICPEFVGHGVGRWFHSAPMVLPVASKMPDTMQVSVLQSYACACIDL